MDSDALRQLEFFTMPNGQTVNPVDQPYLSGTSAQQPGVWDPTGLNLDAGLSPSTTAPTSLSLDSATQPSPLTGLSTVSPDLSSASRNPTQGVQSRTVLPAHGPRSRDSHDRKRSRLSTDAATATTSLDSVDYWIDFDKDEGLASIPESFETVGQNVDNKGKAPMTQRPANPTQSQPTVKQDEFIDDSALDNALSDDDGFSSINLADQLSKIDTQPPQEVPPREGLYSTPLSWERPQPGLRMDSLIGLHSPSLNEAEQRRLIAIAMNPGPSMGGLGSNINFNFTGMSSNMPAMTFGAGLGSTGLGGTNTTTQGPQPVSPPQPPVAQPRPPPPSQPKKQGSVSEKGKEGKPKTGDRTAHNDIERKYRTNLKDKISELRNAVPSLRTISDNGTEDDGTQRPAKVSKGTVLTKATEYIHYLERRNKQIMQEHRELSRRLQAFEQLLNATARQTYTMPTYSRTLFDPRGFC
ncbi:hypothetical protein VTJ49DRAFT_4394 [Mycothermus thermophilus]|uniref:BHLH domain-containing protein n=1 Tax=Humicola insolens TaxID=85995 RepID=A0ABR3V5I3_HUMIN